MIRYAQEPGPPDARHATAGSEFCLPGCGAMLCRQAGFGGSGLLSLHDPALVESDFQEFGDIGLYVRAGKCLLERRQDIGEGALAVATAQDRTGACAEPDHAFGVEKDMGALRFLPLKPEARCDRDRPIMRQLPAHPSSSKAGYGVIPFPALVCCGWSGWPLAGYGRRTRLLHAAPTMPSNPMLSGSDPAINDGVAAAAIHAKRGNARRSAMIGGAVTVGIGTMSHRETACRGVGGNRCGGRFPSGRIGYSVPMVSVMPA